MHCGALCTRGLRLGDLNLIDVSQLLKTNVGQTYQVSFFLAVDGEHGDLLRVHAGNQLLANLAGTPYAPFAEAWFSQYVYDFKANYTQTQLTFQYQSPKGDRYLSNVSVLAVPEPGSAALMPVGVGVVISAFGRVRWEPPRG